MRILYNFPSRSRPAKALSCIDNITYTSKTSNYKILLKIDEDDFTCNCDEFINSASRYENVEIKIGTSKNKIHAINRDIPEDGYDLLLTMSDDMFFIKKGFDEAVRNSFIGFDGLVHFPDQVAGQRLITYPMMSKKYYERFGYVYHPDYVSVYCDHEQQEVAKILGCYKFVDVNILEHRHSIWGFGEPDELLQKTENPVTYARDRRTLDYRRSINFGL